MSDLASLTIELPRDLADKLDRLAQSTDRTESYWIVQAIEELLAVQEWHLQAIQEGIDAADRGDVVSHDDMRRRVNQWAARAS